MMAPLPQLPKDDPRADTEEAAKKYGWENVDRNGYSILEKPHGLPQRKRLIVIGAGATGICMAKFAEALANLDVQIYEKNEEVSGTWWENRYPGCGCDIPSHIYQFQWAMNPNWSHYYASAAEIFEYFKGVVESHGLRKYIKLQHRVIHASWNSQTAKWVVEVQRADGSSFTDECDYLLNGCGLLNNWKWPTIKGLHTFKGPLLHSAAYDESTILDGKRVAVLGAGSSGVQIVANIQPLVKHLYTWVRSPIWITSGFASKFAGPNGQNFKYGEDIKRRFAEDPVSQLRYIKMLDAELGQRFYFNFTNTDDAKMAKEFSQKAMQEKLKDRPDLIKKLIPTAYGPGCRRPTPGNGYLEALMQPNVTTYTEEVQEITPTGFIDSEGQAHEVDIIICATGFDTSYVPRFPVLANGKDLRKEWANDPVSYFSVMVPEFPNYFLSIGPYSATNGSLLPPIEHGCKYICKIIEKCQIEYIRSIAPKEEVMREFREHSDLFLKRTVWNQKCRSWYKGGTIDGLPRLYPASRAHYIVTMEPRYEDFVINYESSNRFHFWGNGFTVRELDGRDPTWYLGIVDGLDKQPDYTEDEKAVLFSAASEG
jgi:cation diffusion facilitator CzcD-associated flavoprotein CzcO